MRAKDKDGYGYFTPPKDKLRKAHRVAVFLFIGEYPSSKVHVCHKCDNPSCVNPEHLFLGTPRDNVRDCYKKRRSRHQKGDRPERLRKAIAAYKEGKLKIDEIVEKYGISSSCLGEHTNAEDRFNPKKKLTYALAEQIREEREHGRTVKALSRAYKVYSIRRVIRYETWT